MRVNKAVKERQISLYKKMVLIRKSEEIIIRYYHENEMKTPMHMSMGEEAIAAGVCQALSDEDMVLGTYRSHAVYLAKTQDVGNFFAEMYGKDSALLKGKGGSMHLCDPQRGFLGTSAIVASAIPVALGVAFANKRKNNKRMVAVFFGDGATEEGAFWESLNIASLMKLPLLFVCEDNGLAVHTHARDRRGFDSLTDVVSRFHCRVFKADTTDPEKIYALAAEAVRFSWQQQIPCFLHLKYYRCLEHVGINYDFDAGYRSKEEFDAWCARDPLRVQRKKLRRAGIAETQLAGIEQEIEQRVRDGIAAAKQAPFCPAGELCQGVFHEEDNLL